MSQDSQTPPVPLGVVNKLDDAEKREQQAQNDATVNEWRTAPGEAGTLGRFGKVCEDLVCHFGGGASGGHWSVPSMRGSADRDTQTHTPIDTLRPRYHKL